LHILGFIAGALGASAIVVVVAVGSGFSGLAAVGTGAASLVLAQLFYVLWLAAMERAEARRRKATVSLPDTLPQKPTPVVQKS
jgi:hypothetical protein